MPWLDPFLSISSHFSYKHAIDGVMRVTREEGFRKLFNGADWASGRAVLVTVGQLCFYDVVKERLLETGRFHDDTRTHLLSSVTAVSTTSASATRRRPRKRHHFTR